MIVKMNPYKLSNTSYLQLHQFLLQVANQLWTSAGFYHMIVKGAEITP